MYARHIFVLPLTMIWNVRIRYYVSVSTRLESKHSNESNKAFSSVAEQVNTWTYIKKIHECCEKERVEERQKWHTLTWLAFHFLWFQMNFFPGILSVKQVHRRPNDSHNVNEIQQSTYKMHSFHLDHFMGTTWVFINMSQTPSINFFFCYLFSYSYSMLSQFSWYATRYSNDGCQFWNRFGIHMKTNFSQNTTEECAPSSFYIAKILIGFRKLL